MFRALLPYSIVAFLILAIGAIGYGRGYGGIAGTYATLSLVLFIMGVGYVRWDNRQHDESSRRR